MRLQSRRRVASPAAAICSAAALAAALAAAQSPLHHGGYVVPDVAAPGPAAAADDPTPFPGAVVRAGRGRFTVLSPAVVRLQLACEAAAADDDRASLAVVNRRLSGGVPPFTVARLNATAVAVATATLTLVYDDAPAAACCADAACRPTLGWRGFSRTALAVAFTVTPTLEAGSWAPGDVDGRNLRGAYRSLDCYSDPMRCDAAYRAAMGPGLLSRSGWVVVNDTGTDRLVPAAAAAAAAGLPFWWAPAAPRAVDLYFAAHGTRYRAALAEWARLAGPPPLPPRWAFGVWWSRYWPYSEASLPAEVLAGYVSRRLPLSAVVLDMDWHKTDPRPPRPGVACSGWGNLDPNATLWPSLGGFAEQLHAGGGVLAGRRLRLSLNLHPDAGVDACDDRYAAVAAAVGTDPSTLAPVPCSVSDPAFVGALYGAYLDAPPLAGVDAWWTDYGGCAGAGSAQASPQLWSNLVFHARWAAVRRTRGLGFSRYGGLGSHRAPMGFSGDTFQHEATLGYQVDTTATAANVLFGVWSHDVGGNHLGAGCDTGGSADPANATSVELFLRWLQFGALLPVLRTHCDHCERRPWAYGPAWYPLLADALRLHAALEPLLYSETAAGVRTGVAAVHPVYYDAPGFDAAYDDDGGGGGSRGAFLVGAHLLAAPVTEIAIARRWPPGDGGATAAAQPEDAAAPVNATAAPPPPPPPPLQPPFVTRTVWLPPGRWSDWNGSTIWEGPVTVTASYRLGDVPLFVRGGLLPLAADGSGSPDFADPLTWAVFPSARRRRDDLAPSQAAVAYTLYEDNGTAVPDPSVAPDASAALTTAYLRVDGGGGEAGGGAGEMVTLTVQPTMGRFAGMPATRAHELQVRGWPPSPVRVLVNGAPVHPGPGTPGWSTVPPAHHSLVAPAGALQVRAGRHPVDAFLTVTVEY